MQRYSMVGPAAAWALVATSALAGGVQQETDERYQAPGDVRVSLKNLNGDVRLEGWEQKVITVTAVKSAGSEERLEDATVNVEFKNGHLRVDVDYADDDHRHHHGDWVSVDFVIRVPRAARVDAIEIVNGDLTVRDVRGDVEASSVNGEVTGDGLGGVIRLSTVNGEVSLYASDRARSIRMNSVNGGVRLVLPKKLDADLEVSTLHGTIRSADGLVVDDSHFAGSSLKATLGKGGMPIDLSTVNGSIEVLREGESGSRDDE